MTYLFGAEAVEVHVDEPLVGYGQLCNQHIQVGRLFLQGAIVGKVEAVN